MLKAIGNIATSIVLVGALTIGFAKIGDPPPVIDGDVIYQSHANYVEAIDRKTQRQLWKTVVFECRNEKLDPHLEADVQMNIISVIKLQGQFIYIRNKQGDEFLLIKGTGKVKTN